MPWHPAPPHVRAVPFVEGGGGGRVARHQNRGMPPEQDASAPNGLFSAHPLFSTHRPRHRRRPPQTPSPRSTRSRTPAAGSDSASGSRPASLVTSIGPSRRDDDRRPCVPRTHDGSSGTVLMA